MSRRIARLEEVIQREISNCLQFKIQNPSIGFVTISRISLSADLAFANVYASIFGSPAEQQIGLRELKKCAPFLRTHLARNMHTRTVPKLNFILDENLEHAANIDKLLLQINTPPQPPEKSS